jgi:two-component system LytT family response regulator
MISVVIVEDEQKNVNILSRLLEEHCPSLEIKGAAGDVIKGYELIKKEKPDLIFLDIEMPYGNGFDLLDQLKPLTFEVIFITAFNHYAIQAFKYNSIDYLLKPIDEIDLKRAIERAEERIRNKSLNENLLNFLKELKQQSAPNKIGLPTQDGYLFIYPEKIIRCEADGAYTFIYHSENEKLIVSKSLKEFESMLDPAIFCRVHHSHIININFVKKYQRGKGGYLELEDGSHIEVSARKKNDFLDKYKIISTPSKS